jgi:hypothetical protein
MRPTSRSRTARWVTATLLVAASAAAQQVGYNDLTNEGPNPLNYNKFTPDSNCESIGGSFGALSECPRKTYPFKLSLLSLDTSELQVGGEVMVLLRLRNVGRDPASVPWITDPDQIELPDDNGTFKFSQADLRANITPDDGGTAYIHGPVHLYGAKGVSGSLQEVRPGEYVELRIVLALDCKNGGFQCQFLKAGPAQLSFTWTELDVRETYEKCRTQGGETTIRELTSDTAAVDIIEESASE